MDPKNVVVYCQVNSLERLRALGYLKDDAPDSGWKDAWVLTVDGSVQYISEEEFQAMLQATNERLGR
jgi:hypothetical protein